MTYCKMVRNDKIVDIGNLFMRWVSKNNTMAYCEINRAEFIRSSLDEERIYRSNWLAKPSIGAPVCEEIQLVVISETEYDELYALLSDGEPVMEEPNLERESEEEEPEREESVSEVTEKPMTVQEMRDKIAELEEAIATIMQKI